jgi:hypothetical protein
MSSFHFIVELYYITGVLIWKIYLTGLEFIRLAYQEALFKDSKAPNVIPSRDPNNGSRYSYLCNILL